MADLEIKVRLTHYWPYTAKALEELMEGDPVEAAGFAKQAGRSPQPLRTVEDFLSGKSDYVSLAGDWEAWPFGQKLLIPWGDKTLVGRIVDTGGHFYGPGKVYRSAGYEPIDVCVYSKSNAPPSSKVVATIVEGDAFDTSKGINFSKLAGLTSVDESKDEETQNKTTALLVLFVAAALLVGVIV